MPQGDLMETTAEGWRQGTRASRFKLKKITHCIYILFKNIIINYKECLCC